MKKTLLLVGPFKKSISFHRCFCKGIQNTWLHNDRPLKTAVFSGFLAAFTLIFSIFLMACSFNYGTAFEEDLLIPEMVLSEVQAFRYEKTKLSIEFQAKVLEMYEEDSIWVAADVSFKQFSLTKEGTLEVEGSTSLFVSDENLDIYKLGQKAMFHLLEEDMFVSATDLMWNKKDQSLVSGFSDLVRLEKGDGTRIEGKGFSANTLSREYLFREAVSGVLVTEKDDSDIEVSE